MLTLERFENSRQPVVTREALGRYSQLLRLGRCLDEITLETTQRLQQLATTIHQQLALACQLQAAPHAVEQGEAES